MKGGILGSYSELKSGEVACLVASECEKIGSEPSKIKMGTKVDLDKALLVEFLKH